MAVTFFDLKRQYQSLREEMDKAVLSVLESGHFILGPEVKALESELASYIGVKHALGVGNGSDALVLALDALDIGPGDEVITSTFTFFASAECIAERGATPIFVDIDPNSYNMDPKAVRAAITPRTKAIIAVHIFGQMSDMTELAAIAREHNLYLVEDCAQAIGADFNGQKAGSMGVISTFSFFPTKNLGAYGDGGLVVTNDDALAELIRCKREHGRKIKYHHFTMGRNSRLDEMQAAILRVKLPHLAEWNTRRRALAAAYNQAFAQLPLRLPLQQPNCYHIYHLYVVMVDDRAAFMSFMKERGIGTGLYYDVPMHLQEVFAGLGYHKGDLPVSEGYCDTMVALPCYPEMTDEEQLQVIDAVKEYCATR